MSLKPCRKEIKQKLLQRMGFMKERNKSPWKGAFVDNDYLDTTFESQDIEQIVREDFPDMENKRLESLCTTIRTHRRKTFAILIIREMTERILELPEDNVSLHDEALFNAPFQTSSAYSRDSFPWTSFSTDISDVLYDGQWRIPPRLSRTHHQFFPVKDFIFPFTSVPSHIGQGTFGDVYKIDIAEGHIEYKKGYTSQTPKALKRVRLVPLVDLPMKRVLNEVNTLRARQHPNIMPLLASFSAGDINTTAKHDEEEYLYMVLPCADGNLQKWMEHIPPNHLDKPAQSHIYHIMLSIASGLAFIHKEINEQVSHHHDLKPENILYFDSGDEFPTWKISDFGGSSLKYTKEGSGSAYRIGSAPYVPPEYFVDDGRKHGRAFDIFSLGTIILELATLWKYEWKDTKLKLLKDRIKAESSQNTRIIDPSRNRPAYCRAMNTVRDWILELRDDDSRKFTAILDLVDNMLEMQPGRRIFAWEVEIDLFSFVGPKQLPKNIITRLKNIVQGPNKGIIIHNPLVRARQMKRSPEFLQTLIEAKWSDNIPGLPEELQIRPKKFPNYFSTLTVLEDKNRLYGCVEDVRWIEEKFAEANILGLYGLGGVGKTHIALHYAQRFRTPPDSKMRKHTFWVNADSERRVQESYGDIAREIGSDQFASGWDVSNSVKTWLENANNGPWFMIVDGFEYSTTMLRLLPRSTNGQVLITARDRGSLETICTDWARTREVRPPEPEVCLNIFRYHLEDIYDDDDLDGTKELLKKLCLPLIIKMAALHMNKRKIPVSAMREDFSQDGYAFDRINQFVTPKQRFMERKVIEKRFMEMFLNPLYRSNPNPSIRKWPPALKLLVFLSCLNKDKIGIKLIRANYERAEHADLDDFLATLVNCAFVEKVGGGTYRMLKFIQDGVIDWVRDKKGEAGVFRALSNALAAILVRYDQKKNDEHVGRADRLHVATYEWKQPFMQHFSRAVQFIKEAREVSDPLKLETRAIECLEVFSQAYFEEGRYGDAIDVLEFALRFCDSSYQPKKKTFQTATKLIRTLAKAKIRRAAKDDPRQAMNLLHHRIEELKKVENSINTSEKSEFRLLEWELLLDFVRLCWQCGRYRQARISLKDLGWLDFQIRDNKANFLREDLIIQLVDKQGKAIRKMQLFAIRARHERGLLELAEGKQILEQRWIWSEWRAARAWIASRKTLSEAKQALVIWNTNEQEEIMDIEGSIADVNLMIGSRKCLQEAEDMLRRHVEQRKDLRVSKKTLWDTEYKLSEVLIEGNESSVQEAINILTQLLEHHDELFGEENKETKSCANLLRKAYRKAGKSSEISRLEETYKLHADPINEHNQAGGRARTRWVFLGPSIFIFYLAHVVFMRQNSISAQALLFILLSNAAAWWIALFQLV